MTEHPQTGDGEAGAYSDARGTEPFARLYECPEALDLSFAHERIFAPVSYPIVRRLSIVPIVHSEALAMAAWFPVCWRAHAGEFHLSALRSLLPDAEGSQPPGSPRLPASLPLALRSYPVAITPGLGHGGAMLVERSLADQPTDAGAPLFLANGKPSRGLIHRYRSAMIARHAAVATAAITADLALAGAFRPWTLSLEVQPGRRLSVPDLWHVPAEGLEDAALQGLLGRHGVDAAVLLSAHRLSLFRVGTLLKAARRALAAEARPRASGAASGGAFPLEQLH
jgi:hypothetical protein